MRRLVVNLDDELDLWLSQQKNQNELVRKALQIYKSDITTDSIDGFRNAFKRTNYMLKEIDSKIDYLARLLK